MVDSPKKPDTGESETLTGKFTIMLNGKIVSEHENKVVRKGDHYHLNFRGEGHRANITGPWPLDENGVPVPLVLEMKSPIQVSTTIRAIDHDTGKIDQVSLPTDQG